jgi:alpha/beta superfamily hydrolase
MSVCFPKVREGFLTTKTLAESDLFNEIYARVYFFCLFVSSSLCDQTALLKRLCKAIRGKSTFTIIDDADHAFSNHSRQFVEIVEDFIKTCVC